MTDALRIMQGRFGRVALLDMDTPLVAHAHSQCHMVFKVGGADSSFVVRGREYPLTDRQAVVVNAWEPHCYPHRAADRHTLFLALYVEPAWLVAIERSMVASASPLFFRHPALAMSRTLRAQVEGLLGDLLSDHDAPQENVEHAIFDIMIPVMEGFSNWRTMPPVMNPAGLDPRIAAAVDYLESHVGSTVEMSEVARWANLSRPHFFTLFRNQMRMTPNVYLNMLRMEQACMGLGSVRSGAIGRLSGELGFSRQHHFTRFFRQHQGITPRAYQRTVQVYEQMPYL